MQSFDWPVSYLWSHPLWVTHIYCLMLFYWYRFFYIDSRLLYWYRFFYIDNRLLYWYRFFFIDSRLLYWYRYFYIDFFTYDTDFSTKTVDLFTDDTDFSYFYHFFRPFFRKNSPRPKTLFFFLIDTSFSGTSKKVFKIPSSTWLVRWILIWFDK